MVLLLPFFISYRLKKHESSRIFEASKIRDFFLQVIDNQLLRRIDLFEIPLRKLIRAWLKERFMFDDRREEFESVAGSNQFLGISKQS